MGWIVAAGALVALVLLRKYSRPKWLWALHGLLAALVGAGFFLFTSVGGWVARTVGRAFGWVGGLLGVSAGAVAGVILLGCAIVAVMDICADKRADGPALAALALAPMFAVLTSGPLADGILWLYRGYYGGGGQAISTLVGG